MTLVRGLRFEIFALHSKIWIFNHSHFLSHKSAFRASELSNIMKLSFDANVLDRLLKSMYRLPNRSVLHLQDETSCRQFLELMIACLEGVVSSIS
jgi:hypothetical protein